MNLSLIITLHNPAKLVFGCGCFQSFVNDLEKAGYKNIFILAIPEIENLLSEATGILKKQGCRIEVNTSIRKEPSFEDYRELLELANQINPDCIVGIGGGSVLDTAKLLAATVGSDVDVRSFLAGEKKLSRVKAMICLPTTSGTGSEVSPNAIFFDPDTGGKVGVIDPHLVPDATYVDPELTKSVPPSVTAATGLDALTHCIEAYVNNFSNPITDLFALEGIKLIGQNLLTAFRDGDNMEAREKVALGSMYGGMCLGPVNTGAVHALAYPLGSTFKIPHGVSNAMLLPYVLEFNLDKAVTKYANVAKAMGVQATGDEKAEAKTGIEQIKAMIKEFKIPGCLSDLNIQEKDIEEMAKSALKIQRLLKNNVREVLLNDAIDIYKKAY
ncbi:iron-containing alcohol dehydrogenase [uncultured Draconibacterium sp.]|uniref:iron-containing alcohol dehydrogenase n=1 Tax=uncultured Draconibacterium sp. TaxID=1573823 RepID=UPI003260D742